MSGDLLRRESGVPPTPALGLRCGLGSAAIVIVYSVRAPSDVDRSQGFLLRRAEDRVHDADDYVVDCVSQDFELVLCLGGGRAQSRSERR